jgi:hypothetical protein
MLRSCFLVLEIQFLNKTKKLIMGVDISKLTVSPESLSKGITSVTLQYYGVVYNSNDNPVSLKLLIEPLGPLSFIENGNRTKLLKSAKTFNINVPALYTWQIEIELLGKDIPPSPKSCSIRLEATDKHGYKSSTNSFIIYY